MADETKTDTDADGLSDAVERQLGTNINKADSDGDGLIDGFEVAVGQPRVRDLSITDPAGSAAIVDDLVTGLEQIIGVTKHNVDSDGDGFADWVEEMRGGTDRNVADLTPAQIQNNQNSLEEFISRAQSQTGVPYRFGAEADLNDSSGAAAFDSSELVQWAAHQAGVELPDGSWKQYQALHDAGSAVRWTWRSPRRAPCCSVSPRTRWRLRIVPSGRTWPSASATARCSTCPSGLARCERWNRATSSRTPRPSGFAPRRHLRHRRRRALRHRRGLDRRRPDAGHHHAVAGHLEHG